MTALQQKCYNEWTQNALFVYGEKKKEYFIYILFCQMGCMSLKNTNTWLEDSVGWMNFPFKTKYKYLHLRKKIHWSLKIRNDENCIYNKKSSFESLLRVRKAFL